MVKKAAFFVTLAVTIAFYVWAFWPTHKEGSVKSPPSSALATNLWRESHEMLIGGTKGDDTESDKDFHSLCKSKVFSTPASSNTNLIVKDGFNKGFGTNHGCITAQNEPTVAVNPTNPLNIVAGSNDYRDCCSKDSDGHNRNDGGGWAYVSKDGGVSWVNVQLPGTSRLSGGTGSFAKFDAVGDPSLAFASDGTLYYANMGFSRVKSDSGLLVSVSHDGGITWGNPNLVQYDNDKINNPDSVFNDKEWIAVDPNDSKTLYVTWTRFITPPGNGFPHFPIEEKVSHDGGVTWSGLNNVTGDDYPYNQGSQPVVAPDGSLWISFESASFVTSYTTDAIVLAHSTDGKSFTRQEVGEVFDFTNCYPTNDDDRYTLSGERFRLTNMPSMAIDASTGEGYIVWADNQHAGTCGDAFVQDFVGRTSEQVKLVTFSSSGVSSKPQVVSTGRADKAMPAVTAAKGRALVTFYSRTPTKTPYCLAGSTDGKPVCMRLAGQFVGGKPFWISDGPFNPNTNFDGTFLGDYIQSAVMGDSFYSVWTDTRPTGQDIFGAVVH